MKTRSLFAAFALLLSFSMLSFSCKKDDEPTGLDSKPDDLPNWKPFAGTSLFYQAIGASPTIDANSASMVQSLEQEAQQGFVLAVKEWTVPVYFAESSTPRYDVKLTAGWAPKSSLNNVPVPDFAEPDPEDDGHMVIVDTSGGCIYDFWQARKQNGDWKASWANAVSLSGDGIFPKGMSCRGSGFELLQGMVWPQELQNGRIDHALLFSFDITRDGGPVSPATESDGTTSGNSAIPEGALVQLNPSLDLDALGLTGYTKTIARALQEYGMYCGDDGGGITLYAVHPSSTKNNPYSGLLPDLALVDLTAIPTDQFRVLDIGTQNPNPTLEVVQGNCNNFTN